MRPHGSLDPMFRYFEGEKHAGALALALGLLAVAGALWLWRDAGPYRAMLYPLAIVGIIELGVGVGLLVKTGPQVATLTAAIEQTPEVALSRERERIVGVNARFELIKAVELMLIALAAALIVFSGRPEWVGVGLGILLQATALLAFDIFAEQRAHLYAAWLGGS